MNDTVIAPAPESAPTPAFPQKFAEGAVVRLASTFGWPSKWHHVWFTVTSAAYHPRYERWLYVINTVEADGCITDISNVMGCDLTTTPRLKDGAHE